MASYDLDLLNGVGQWLAGQGIGSWSETANYTPTQTGIVLDTMPSSPDNVIVLSAYAVTDDPSQEVNVTGVQVRNRAAGQDPRPARETAGDLFRVLHGRTHLTLPTGLQVTQILRRSATSGGQDTNGRWSMIQNFYTNVHAPSMHVFEESP